MDPELLARRLATLESLAGPHALKQIGEGRCAIHTKEAVVDAAAVDTKKLFVPCTITTQDADREKDVVVTAGIDLADHQNSPVVLLDHGFTFGTGKYPSVAQALDEAGNYSVTREPTRLRSISRFSEKIKDSSDTFALVAEGLLNGVSIGFTIDPNGAKARDDHEDGYRGWPGLLIAHCKLLEYSHCPIGINQYALADKIGKGTLNGEKLGEYAWKAMSAYLPPLKEMVKGGFDPDILKKQLELAEQSAGLLKQISERLPEAGGASEKSTHTGENAVSEKTNDTAAEPTPAEKEAVAMKAQVAELTAANEALKKAAADREAADKAAKDEAAKKAVTPGKKAEGMNEEEGSDGGYVPLEDDKSGDDPKENVEVEDDPTKDWLPGAKVLGGIYGMLAGAAECVVAGYSQQENQNVVATLDALSEGLEGMCGSVDECFRSEYPDYDPPSGKKKAEGEDDAEESDDDSDPDEDRDDEEKKSRLSPHAKALASRFKALLAARAEAAVKSAPVASESDEVKALKSENADLKGKLSEALAAHKQLQREIRKRLDRR